jgi:hypothetical protein
MNVYTNKCSLKEALNPNNQNQQYGSHQIPDTCPICHKSGTMSQIGSAYISSVNELPLLSRLQIPFRCPRFNCGVIFIVEYNVEHAVKFDGCKHWKISRFTPAALIPPSMGKEIKDISPSFCELYKQAYSAKNYGLIDVFGLALRKALEFLIKDYAISKYSVNEDAIKASSLSQVINKYVTDQNIKNCAERAAWLGNDEAHYERRWVDRDVTHLESSIKLTMSWIFMEMETNKYVSEMPK